MKNAIAVVVCATAAMVYAARLGHRRADLVTRCEVGGLSPNLRLREGMRFYCLFGK